MKQLTIQEREHIYWLYDIGHTQETIAKYVGRNQSTISREISRNKASPRLGYLPDRAQKKANKRKKEAKQNSKKWWQKKSLLDYVKRKLKDYWSPEQIAGRLKEEYTGKEQMRVSHESIYLYVYEEKKQGGELYKYLRQGKRKRQRRGNTKQKRGIIPHRVSIDQRPEEVARKARYGDWEGDLVIGKNHKGAVATMVERKALYTLAMVIQDKKAKTMRRAVQKLYKPIPKQLRKTMTYDNGKEMTEHKKISKKLRMDIYFAHPYSSWERGLNENTNGLLRQFFPKGTNFNKVTQDEVDQAVHLLNTRPRKTLHYRTPKEVFNEQLKLCV